MSRHISYKIISNIIRNFEKKTHILKIIIYTTNHFRNALDFLEFYKKYPWKKNYKKIFENVI